MSLEPITISYKKWINPSDKEFSEKKNLEISRSTFGYYEEGFSGTGTFLGWSTGFKKETDEKIERCIGSSAIIAVENGTVRIFDSFRIKFDCFVISK